MTAAAVALIISLVVQRLLVFFDASGWMPLFMLPFLILHPIYFLVFLVLYTIQSRASWLFCVLIPFEWILFIITLIFPSVSDLTNFIPSYLLLSLFA